jgi:hypothetical protein
MVAAIIAQELRNGTSSAVYNSAVYKNDNQATTLDPAPHVARLSTLRSTGKLEKSNFSYGLSLPHHLQRRAA